MGRNSKFLSAEIPNDEISLKRFIEEIHSKYENWYNRTCKLNYLIWYALQIISLASGVLASIFIAIKDPKEWSNFFKIVCVSLPAIGSFSGSVLIKMKIFDTWKLREEGRIAFQNLVNDGNSRIYQCKSQSDFHSLHSELVLKVNTIESDQAARFFSLYGMNFVAIFNSKN